MGLEIPEDNLLPGPGALAAVVLAQPNEVAASLHTAACEATHKMPYQASINALYPANRTSNDPTINHCLIAGLGTKTNESCGDGIYKRSIHCSAHPEHERYEVGGTYCKQPQCPICWPYWAHRAADRISCRIDGYKQFVRHPPRHLIFSLDPEDVDLDKLFKMSAKRAYDIIKEIFIEKAYKAGVTGGALIVHTTRTNDLVPRDLDIKKWDYVRKQGAQNFFNLVDFEIHAHIAGYGYLVTPEKGQFLYKNKGPLRDRDDVERWAYYAVSHAPIIPGKQAVIYFGTCSNRKLKPAYIRRCTIELRCQECGAVMVYDDFNEVVMTKRTFADWVIVQEDYTPTKQASGPPGQIQEMIKK